MSCLLGAASRSLPTISGMPNSVLKEIGVPKPFTVVLERDAQGLLLHVCIGAQLVDDYLGYLTAIGRAHTTCSSYAYDLAVFCRWLAAERPQLDIEDALRTLTPSRVLGFVAQQRDSGQGRQLALSTVYRRVTALAKFFDWAEVNGVVDRNPVPRERPRMFNGRRSAPPAFLRVPKPLPRPAPVEEVSAFFASLQTWRDRALVGLLLGAGLRLSEALGLQLSDLDWGGKQVFIRQGKGGRQRWAMAPDAAWAALKAYLEIERPEPAAADERTFVVLHGAQRGKPLTTNGVQSLFRHHRRLAQTPNITPHRLRHSCGTNLHRAGMSLEFIQEQLGHRRLDSTRLYVHISNERLRSAYEAVQPRLYVPPTVEGR